MCRNIRCDVFFCVYGVYGVGSAEAISNITQHDDPSDRCSCCSVMFSTDLCIITFLLILPRHGFLRRAPLQVPDELHASITGDPSHCHSMMPSAGGQQRWVSRLPISVLMDHPLFNRTTLLQLRGQRLIAGRCHCHWSDLRAMPVGVAEAWSHQRAIWFALTRGIKRK